MEALKKPCNDCPFRKNSLPGWLADYRPEELHRIVMSEMPFPCHLTHDTELSWEETENYPLCAGALMYMKVNAKSPRDAQLNKLVQSVDKSELQNILSISEFLTHHKP